MPWIHPSEGIFVLTHWGEIKKANICKYLGFVSLRKNVIFWYCLLLKFALFQAMAWHIHTRSRDFVIDMPANAVTPSGTGWNPDIGLIITSHMSYWFLGLLMISNRLLFRRNYSNVRIYCKNNLRTSRVGPPVMGVSRVWWCFHVIR